jgi:eukaryotic-like serine/threonine-protein kinase
MGMDLPTQNLGKYELQKLLGRGGMAEVWKALDTQLQRYCAIKILHTNLQHDPDFIKRFLREARAVASLHHPNIVQIYDFQTFHTLQSGGTIAYMVMDYIEGHTLADYIAGTSHKRRFPKAEDIVHLFTSISQAVDYAHAHGMIHRDIKPANILLDQRNTTRNAIGEPVLTDFGIVKLLSAPTRTLEGFCLGTPLYMSPEQAQGHVGDGRSDIYCLGVILFEICTGVRPFTGDRPVSIMQQHIQAMPPYPPLINPAIPDALTEVILRSIAKDPAFRFPSASTMSTALARALNVPQSSASNTASPGLPIHAPGVVDEPVGGSGFYARSLTEADGLTSSTYSTPASSSSASGPTIVPDLQPVQDASLLVSAKDTGVQDRLTKSLSGDAPRVALTPLPSRTSEKPARKRRRVWFIGSIALLMTVLLSSSLLTIAALTRKSLPVAAQRSMEGQAFFVSSGQLNANGYPGVNDELQVNLRTVPDPPAGMSYYAWLLRDITQPVSTPILLGKLFVNHSEVHFLYRGDQQHTDLLAITSRVLITEEDAGQTPINPAPDYSTWRYYAELPQVPDPNDTVHHFSMLDHLRSLLAEDPILGRMGIQGGLESWLLRNTGKVLEWANSARDYWGDQATSLMRLHFYRILDYLDGELSVQADVPPGTPLVIRAPVALLGPATIDAGNYGAQDQVPPDFLHQISSHLNALAQAPGTTAVERKLAAQINSGMKNIGDWLEKVRGDAKKLVLMNDAQLLSQESLSILNDMVTQAFYAYVGRLDPITNQVQAGVTQINYDTEHLTSFDIKPYTSQTTA